MWTGGVAACLVATSTPGCKHQGQAAILATTSAAAPRQQPVHQGLQASGASSMTCSDLAATSAEAANTRGKQQRLQQAASIKRSGMIGSNFSSSNSAATFATGYKTQGY
eukprot:1149145-Pelagomonas_calceolata.AAC.8